MLSNNFVRFHQIIITTSTNPYLNLAKELDLLYDSKKDEKILYLWRNEPVVVIGKHQNPYKECNFEFMKENNIKLARRPTGGGAVYQDLGNTCWSLFGPKFEPKKTSQIIIDALKSLNINANLTGRNDIVVDNKKVSGAAFRRLSNCSIHHGTMLIDVNMHNLSKSLSVDKSKLKSKGVDSVKSRVINLKAISPSITHEKFCEAAINSFQKNLFDNYGEKCQINHLDFAKMMEKSEVAIKFKQFGSNHWLFGNSTQDNIDFSKRFDFGLFDVLIRNQDGAKIGTVHSDCLVNDVVEGLNDYIYDFFDSNGNDGFAKNVYIGSLHSNESKAMASQVVDWIRPLLMKLIN